MFKRVGLGAVWTEDGTSFSFPWYCSFAPVGADCAVPTSSDIETMARAQLAQIAAVNPDLANAALSQGDAAVAALGQANPIDAASYDAVVNPSTNWLLVGGIAAAVVLVLAMAGRR